ncbi:sigma-70 family RNA polymerase sigma factor [Polyangium jinanense]|nr:sigma-70 family RNA polymerase sigma factor [Polyangium jinanense]
MKAAFEDAFVAAQAAWPGVTLDREAFMAYLRERTGEDGAEVAHASDLFLACACLRGDPRAIAFFEAHFLAQVPAFLSRVENDKATIPELLQALREKLLLPSAGGRPKLADYTGQGPLGAWLRVVAVRAALDRKRAQPREVLREEIPDTLLAPSDDPELDYLRVRYAAEFRAAFQDALLSLEPKGRTVLRLHIIDGLNIDRIGVIYGVHRATVARWIADARAWLFERTRGLLSERLSLEPREFESVLRLVGQDLDASVRRILEDESG